MLEEQVYELSRALEAITEAVNSVNQGVAQITSPTKSNSVVSPFVELEKLIKDLNGQYTHYISREYASMIIAESIKDIKGLVERAWINGYYETDDFPDELWEKWAKKHMPD